MNDIKAASAGRFPSLWHRRRVGWALGLGCLGAVLVLATGRCGFGPPDGEQHHSPLTSPTSVSALSESLSASACSELPICGLGMSAQGCRCVPIRWPAWEDWTSHPSTARALRDVCDEDGNQVWLVGWNGLVGYSRDGGNHFGLVDIGTREELTGVDARRRDVLITAGSGTLYRSEDGGLHFRRVAHSFAELKKCTFADQESYAVCGGSEGTIYRYDLVTDKLSKIQLPPTGAAWQDAVSVRAARLVAIAMSRIGESETQLFRSINEGRSFVATARLPMTAAGLWMSRDGQTVVVGTREGDVYRSVNGGGDFTLVYDSPSPTQSLSNSVMSINGSDRGELMVTLLHRSGAYFGSRHATDVLGSSNLGASFVLRAEGLMTDFGWNDPVSAVDFGGMHHGLLLGPDLLVTHNGGRTFRSALSETLDASGTLLEGREQLTELALIGPDAGFAIKALVRAEGRGGWMDESVVYFDAKRRKLKTLYKFPRHGAIAGNLTTHRQLQALDEKHVFLQGVQGLLRSQDGGEHFESVEHPSMTEFGWSILRFADPHHGLFVRSDDAVFLTADAAATLHAVTMPAGCSPASVEYFDLHRAVIACRNGMILESADGGRRFTTARAPSEGEHLTAMVFARDSRVGWVFGEAESDPFLRTDDRGHTFRSVSRPSPSIHRVIAISEDEALIEGDSWLLTRDGGRTWRSSTGPTTSVLAAGAFGKMVYVATGEALWRTQLDEH